MPCTVKKTFETARDTGSFLVAQVKTNQQILHDGIEAICAAHPPTDSAETVDRTRHGRQEYRLVETIDVIGRLGSDWDGLIVAAARVTRLTWHKDTNTGLWRQTSKTALYASQISLSATAIAAAIRQHWRARAHARARVRERTMTDLSPEALERLDLTRGLSRLEKVPVLRRALCVSTGRRLAC
jgi:hypothetical protein